MNRFLLGVFLFLAMAGSLFAQWPPILDKKIPRTPDGMPNLSAPAPRTADGKVDFSGIWGGSARGQLHPGFMNIGRFVQDGIPYKPGTQDKARESTADRASHEMISRCLPVGPTEFHTLEVRKIVQTPDLLLYLSEFQSYWRQIFLDGRPLPNPEEVLPWWFGYSSAKWEGDTLVVQSTGYKDEQWLDPNGTPFSDASRVTERYRRPDLGHLNIDITIDDPKNYTKPFTASIQLFLLPDTELLEYICLENERDRRHFVVTPGGTPASLPGQGQIQQ